VCHNHSVQLQKTLPKPCYRGTGSLDGADYAAGAVRYDLKIIGQGLKIISRCHDETIIQLIDQVSVE